MQININIKNYLSVHLLLHHPQQSEGENGLKNLKVQIYFINDNDNGNGNGSVDETLNSPIASMQSSIGASGC